MSATLKKSREYIVTISLDGYQSEIVLVGKGDFEKAVLWNLCVGGIIGVAIDASTGAMFGLEPSTINVELKEVTALDGGDTAIYAFLTIVDEDGTPRYATVEMKPTETN